MRRRRAGHALAAPQMNGAAPSAVGNGPYVGHGERRTAGLLPVRGPRGCPAPLLRAGGFQPPPPFGGAGPLEAPENMFRLK